jgi:hypothetical protein
MKDEPFAKKKNLESQDPLSGTQNHNKEEICILSALGIQLRNPIAQVVLVVTDATQHRLEPASSVVALSPGICLGYLPSGRRLPPQGSGAGSGESDIRIGL